ncbi:MAG: hypothetical protein GC164_11425 [Phycisphaera sp.]|nr:hypothetical protein [Phycisphaera sp.]
MYTCEDTIVAVGSPPGRAVRGIVRLSGSGTNHLLSLAGVGVDGLTARRMSVCTVELPPILPAMVATFRGPASYTGQDMAELHLPGNPVLLDRVMHRFVELGARLAEPGEFTYRAFIASKLDLTQAEGVAATIGAQSDGELHAASMLREGRLGAWADELVNGMARLLALVEAGIDFTDQEDVVPITPGSLWQRVSEGLGKIDTMLARSRSWSEVSTQPRVVLVGKPSVGKSTLFNALLGKPRAVVSPLPGVTRDVLTEPLTVRDRTGRAFEILLCDLAGLDTPAGALDERVQHHARRAMAAADLVLHVMLPGEVAATLPGEVRGHVLQIVTHSETQHADHPDGALPVSGTTGRGIAELQTALAGALSDRASSATGSALALQPRHTSALNFARDELLATLALLEPQRDAPGIAGIELVADSMRRALDHLASLGGRMTPDDVIGLVFATFCVGK